MKYSYQVGKLFGVPIRVHVTFLLLLLFVGLFAQQLVGISSGTFAMLMIALIFACVVLHEIGHSLVARHFGVRVNSIILLPIGGVSQMEDLPDDPTEEILIGLAGPAVSVFLALCFLVMSRIVAPATPTPQQITFFSPNIFQNLFLINLMLAIFNLLPVFPMDGGRVVRGLLALRVSKLKATRIAVSIGQFFAIVLFFFGLLYNIWLALIALFIYMGATGEERATEMKVFLHDVPVSRAMLTDFEKISPDDTLAHVVDRMCHAAQDDFPVVAEDKTVGLLSKGLIYRALRDHPRETRVADIMQRDFIVACPTEQMFELFKKLSLSEPRVALVMDADRLLGIINLEQIGKYHMLCTQMGTSYPR
jgi:Zn-dependent protease/predicted transcriptional regulator